MKKTTLALLLSGIAFCFSLTTTLSAQNPKSVKNNQNLNNQNLYSKTNNAPSKQELLKYIKEQLQKSNTENYTTTSQHTSSVSGIKHQYIRQAINGIEVMGTESSLHTKDGNTLVSHVNFVKNISSTVKSTSASLSSEQAISSVSQKMGYGTPINLEVIKQDAKIERTAYQKRNTIYSKAGISNTDIPVKKVYYYTKKTGTVIAWELSIEDKKSSDWYNFIVDANTGEILTKYNFTNSCNITGDHSDHNHDDYLESNNDCKDENTNESQSRKSTAAFVGGGSYNVYAMPVESPGHGGRSVVTDPADITGSPFGWHDTDGILGGESNFTIGNNCDAYDDRTSTQSGTGDGIDSERADGGAALDFNFTVDTNVNNNGGSIDAATTNLFYWTNIIHDVWYKYGFDEASGNFQLNNYGNGGVGNDSVRAEVQDGSGTCNANFSTPTDGGRGRMQMYVCGTRDGDFDNVVVVHEYGHGLSTRLTGGAGNSGCLQNNEQMGEGWGDFIGLLMTMEPGDQGTDLRGIGTWLVGEGPNGAGIRPQPYSTLNTQDYADLGTAVIPHGVGSIWSSILWKLNWALIDAEGWDPDIYNGTGGNNICIALVMEAMKLQPCSPGFVDGRDAILAAETAIYGGAYTDIIWGVFADAGIGVGATQGSTNSNNTTSTTVPPPSVPKVSFGIQNIMINEGTDCSFKDITIPFQIGISASQDATATVSIDGGTASNINDFTLINNSVTFAAGVNDIQDIILRVYSDGFSEADETIDLSFVLNANSGDATIGDNTLTITIVDEDITPITTEVLDLVNSDIEGADTTNWNQFDNDGDGREYVIESGVTYTGIINSFYTSESNGNAISGNNTNYTPDNYIYTDAITIPTSTTLANLSFGIGGFGDNEPYEVYWSTDNTSANTLSNGILLNSGNSIQDGGEIISLDMMAYVGETGYLVFRHNSTGTAGGGPSAKTNGLLLLDNILLQVTVPKVIQTAINDGITNDLVNLSSAGTIFMSDAVTTDLMLDITNTGGFDFDCIDVSVNRAGSTTQPYNGSTGTNLVMDKTFKITPTNTTTNNSTTIEFYVTTDELNAITTDTGLTANQLFAHREGSLDVVPLTVSPFGTDSSKLTGTFTGLAGTYYVGAEGAFKTRVSPKVFLSGPSISGGLMSDALRSGNYLPTTSPYSDAKTVNASVFTVTGNDAIVDWVWVELRDATTNTVITASSSALLQRDGDVVDLDGTSALTLLTPSKSFYVAINHRNHLAIMSKISFSLSATTTVIDFTTSTVPTFGTDAQKVMGSGVFGLWAGDVNGDGKINYLGALSEIPSIRFTVFNDPNNSFLGGPPASTYDSLGYSNQDVDMNGKTKYSGVLNDVLIVRNNIFNNPSNSFLGGPPSSTYTFTQQLP